jgi:hypothetical protein
LGKDSCRGHRAGQESKKHSKGPCDSLARCSTTSRYRES